jgi:hypothetical protein
MTSASTLDTYCNRKLEIRKKVSPRRFPLQGLLGFLFSILQQIAGNPENFRIKLP